MHLFLVFGSTLKEAYMRKYLKYSQYLYLKMNQKIVFKNPKFGIINALKKFCYRSNCILKESFEIKLIQYCMSTILQSI